MIILGILIYIPYPYILIIGILIVFGHNLLDYAEAARDGKVGFWWDMIHHAQFSFYPLSPKHFVIIVYAFLPWTGVMIVGYCFGRLFELEEGLRRKVLIYLGLSLILFFIVLRSVNGYGDPAPWSGQRNATYTFLSFLNVTKYPPSLMFLCITLGPAVILLSLLERVNNPFTRVMNVFGRVPFF